MDEAPQKSSTGSLISKKSSSFLQKANSLVRRREESQQEPGNPSTTAKEKRNTRRTKKKSKYGKLIQLESKSQPTNLHPRRSMSFRASSISKSQLDPEKSPKSEALTPQAPLKDAHKQSDNNDDSNDSNSNSNSNSKNSLDGSVNTINDGKADKAAASAKSDNVNVDNVDNVDHVDNDDETDTNDIKNKVWDKSRNNSVKSEPIPYIGKIQNPSSEKSVSKKPSLSLEEENSFVSLLDPKINHKTSLSPINKVDPVNEKSKILKKSSQIWNKDANLTVNGESSSTRSPDTSLANKSKSNDDSEISAIESVLGDEKIQLFMYPKSKIHVFHDQLTDQVPEMGASGRMLGHGPLSIYKINNDMMVYLSCGSSFVYPLLPKFKVLRIGLNTFMIPLVNPERYWRVIIETEDDDILNNFENVLKNRICYRKLYQPDQFTNKAESSEYSQVAISTPTNSSSTVNILTNSIMPTSDQSKELKEIDIINEIDEIEEFTDNSSNPSPDIEQVKTPLRSTFLSVAIPESPPSAPISPALNFSKDEKFPSNTTNKLNHHTSSSSLTSAMASLEMGCDIKQPRPQHPSKKKSLNSSTFKGKDVPNWVNPFQNPQPGPSSVISDSSTDSLIDEYEESISMTKNHLSRPQSMASLNSAVINVNYQRGSVISRHFDPKDREDDKEFPTTSLSEYHRTHSSHLPTNSSGVNGLVKSRSNYSIASSMRGVDGHRLSSTYQEIYRSITERNLYQSQNDDLKSVKSYYQPRQKHPPVSRSAFTPVKIGQTRKRKYTNSVVSDRPGGLNGEQVYQLIKDKENIRNQQNPNERGGRGGGLYGIFGW